MLCISGSGGKVMSKVNRSNYSDLIPVIKEQLKSATFVCFDAEYSGLQQPPGVESNCLFDSVAERYLKLKATVEYNTSPQVGFSVFRRDPAEPLKNIYNVYCYVAYVAVPSFADFNNDPKAFSLELKCGKFLRKLNFDFNAIKDDSVPCLSKTKEVELKKYLDEHPDFMKMENRYFDKDFFPEQKSQFKEEDKAALISKLRGLSEIVDTILEYRVPLVGHNMGLDLLYFYRLFCADLPGDYDSFKTEVKKCLPSLYDTKYMLQDCRRTFAHPAFKNNSDKYLLKESSLYAAYHRTSQIRDEFRPCIKLDPTCSRFYASLRLGQLNNLEDENNNLVHDPAFDALTTGALFLNVAHIKLRMYKCSDDLTEARSTQYLFKFIENWSDRIYMARASVLMMSLNGKDARPERPQWLIVISKNRIYADTLKNELEAQFGPLDAEQAEDNVVRIAAASAQGARKMRLYLTGKGLWVKKVDIPWDYKSHGRLRRLECDSVYDTTKLLG